MVHDSHFTTIRTNGERRVLKQRKGMSLKLRIDSADVCFIVSICDPLTRIHIDALWISDCNQRAISGNMIQINWQKIKKYNIQNFWQKKPNLVSDDVNSTDFQLRMTSWDVTDFSLKLKVLPDFPKCHVMHYTIWVNVIMLIPVTRFSCFKLPSKWSDSVVYSHQWCIIDKRAVYNYTSRRLGSGISFPTEKIDI